MDFPPTLKINSENPEFRDFGMNFSEIGFLEEILKRTKCSRILYHPAPPILIFSINLSEFSHFFLFYYFAS